MERRIFAHRGLNRVAPENSLAAFEKTADAGLTWIETDVDILGDGTPIVIHDTSLDRTTNRSGSYYGLEKADLASIDAGSWFSPEFTGQPLPTLEQLIELLNRRGLNANIEIKSNEAGGAMSMRLIDSILDALTGLDPEREVFFSVRSGLPVRDLCSLRRLEVHARAGWRVIHSPRGPRSDQVQG